MSNQICTASGKIMHATAAGAYKRIPRRGNRKERAHAYRCPSCHHWHTTSSL